MRIQIDPGTARGAAGFRLPTITTLLLAALTTSAQTTSFTATGWLNGVQCPPLVCTNSLGQVLVRGSAYTARVQATDPRVTGQVRIINDSFANADGTVNMQGRSFLEVGTWDAGGTTFTPTGGLWEWSWTGVMQADYSAQVHIVGYGSGGAIDGLRIDQTMTRAKGAGPFDPTVPYLYTGTILPPPLNTREVVEDFTAPLLWPYFGGGTCFNRDGQFHAAGNFPKPTGTFDSFLLGLQCDPNVGWTVANGTTREWRAELVTIDDNATNMAQLAITDNPAPGYGFHLGRDFAYLMKWSLQGDRYSVLWCERPAAPLPRKNVVLAFALTREDPNVVITARVLDQADPTKVLFAHSYLDTPASDPTLSMAEFQALTGMRITGLYPDSAESPPTAVGVLLGLFQYTDGQQPAPTAIFDNLQLRTSEIPTVGIERAVRLSWPASATINYAVEGAPTVQGPWLPVQDQSFPGFQIQTVPADGAAQFFRLIQAP